MANQAVSYDDIAAAMKRSGTIVKCWASLSRPKAMPWTPVRLENSRQPTRFYPIESVISWCWKSYSHMSADVEARIRKIAAHNAKTYEALQDE